MTPRTVEHDGPNAEKILSSPSSGSLSARNHPKNDPIEYEYLTYETQLPNPSPNTCHESIAGSPPEPPNLQKYSNPFDWPSSRKMTLVWISIVSTAFTAYSAGMYSPGVAQMSAEWGTSRVATLVGITIFTCGFAIAPMILAPFSELAGRRPVFVVTGVLWLLFQIFCAVTRLYVGMLLARFGAGCASSTFSTMVGGVVSDMFHKEDRNLPMALFTGGVLFGTGLGPMIAGFIAQHTTWRWIFWSHAIVVAMLMVLIFFFFYETRGSVLLSRKAKALNAYYDAREAAGYYRVVFSNGSGEGKPRRIRWKIQADEERASVLQMIRTSLTRPFTLLFTEPVVFFFSLFISFAWAVLYMTFSAIPYVFETAYSFSLQQADAVFAAISISAILTTLLAIWQERAAARLGKMSGGPEQRLYFCCVESLAMPIGLFWFGWTTYAGVHWIVPTIAIGFATTGIFSVYLATFNYLADAYGPYASSAIAAQSFCRNLLGGAFPLFTQQMFERLNIGGAASLLGGIAALLTLVPWVLAWYGPRIRARSKICSQLMG